MHYQSQLLEKYNNFAKKVYPFIPFTYYWYLKRTAGNAGKSILDLGCGWGEPMEVLQSAHHREATGVDIFPSYLSVSKKKGIYKHLIKGNILTYQPKHKYDIVICSHVLEHLKKQDGLKVLNKIIKTANQKAIIALPVGNLPQDEYDGNTYQRHLSAWYPKDFRKKGFRVVGITPRFVFGTHDRFKDYGVFAFLLFFVAYLSQPFYSGKPEDCVYMLCAKNI